MFHLEFLFIETTIYHQSDGIQTWLIQAVGYISFRKFINYFRSSHIHVSSFKLN